MKTIYACIIAPLFLFQPLFPQKTAPAYLTVTGHATFRNAYKRGNLDDWWSQQLGMSGEAVDDGSPAFFAFEAGLSLPLTGDDFRMGATFGLIKPAEHAIWGSRQVYGYNLVLEPHIITIGMPIMFKLTDLEGLYARINPAILLGWVTGYYWSPYTELDFVMSPGIGFGLANSVQYFFTDMLGVDFTLGFRMGVKAGLSIDDPESPTGMSIMNLSNGDEVRVNLGGSYMVLGIVARLPIFKMQLP
jgi:hypothetical protein